MSSDRSVKEFRPNPGKIDDGQAPVAPQHEDRRSIPREFVWEQIWRRIAFLDADFWLSRPVARPYDGTPHFSFDDWHNGISHTALVREIEHALSHGLRQSSPPALALLAALVVQHRDDVDAGVRLGQIALTLASRDGVPCLGQTHALFICSILPYTDELHRLIEGVASMVSSPYVPASVAFHGLCTAFVAGASVQSLTSQARFMLSRLPANECGLPYAALSVHSSFLGQLECGESATPNTQVPCRNLSEDYTSGASCTYWMARLLAAWYSYDRNGALLAFRRAVNADGISVPVMDRMALCLFGVLVLSDDEDEGNGEHVWTYCAELTTWAANHPASGAAMAMLANTVSSYRSEASVSLFRGCEAAATCAMRHGQNWLAALAWEEAARHAREAGLLSVTSLYRGQCLVCYERWGAWGRAADLRRRWQEDGDISVCRNETAWNTRIPNGIVGELALSIAHEINQPLSAIALHATATRKWLRREPPDIERAMASLTVISTASKHAFEVVNGLQRLSSSGEKQVRDTDIDHHIRQVLQLLRRPLRKHHVEVEMKLGLENCTVKADSSQLQQVVTNLLMNAIEALDVVDGDRRIKIESRWDDAFVEISVADNGPGIPKAHHGYIFEPTFSTKAHNSGMGLSISRMIVMAHGGRISFHECEATGVRFVVKLPVCGNPSFRS